MIYSHALSQVYYIPVENPDPYPPALDSYINSIASQIGGEVTWLQSSDDVYFNFALTGKSMVMAK